VTFRPGEKETVSGLLNLWQGWGVKAKAGDWGLVDELADDDRTVEKAIEMAEQGLE
jgi:enoyl-CoA hydratase/carnithine racemase